MKYPKAIIKDKKTDSEAIEIDRDRIALPNLSPPKLRTGGEFAELGYFLSDRYDHIIIKDSQDSLVLVSLEKD